MKNEFWNRSDVEAADRRALEALDELGAAQRVTAPGDCAADEVAALGSLCLRAHRRARDRLLLAHAVAVRAEEEGSRCSKCGSEEPNDACRLCGPMMPEEVA